MADYWDDWHRKARGYTKPAMDVLGEMVSTDDGFNPLNTARAAVSDNLGMPGDMVQGVYDMADFWAGGALPNAQLPITSDKLYAAQGGDPNQLGLDRTVGGFLNPVNAIKGAGKSVLKIAAGEGSKTANLKKLDDAKSMLEDGYSRNDIVYDTGWYKGVDGRWKYEIDDSKAKFYRLPSQDTLRSGGRLDETVYHPELFDAYPQLAAAKMGDVRILDPVARGLYRTKTNELLTTPVGAADMYDSNGQYMAALNGTMSNVLHEGQHGVQFFENFARGGNPAEFMPTGKMPSVDDLKNTAMSQSWRKATYDYQRLAGEAEARNAQKRWRYDALMRRETPPWYTDPVLPTSDQIVKFRR